MEEELTKNVKPVTKNNRLEEALSKTHETKRVDYCPGKRKSPGLWPAFASKAEHDFLAWSAIARQCELTTKISSSEFAGAIRPTRTKGCPG